MTKIPRMIAFALVAALLSASPAEANEPDAGRGWMSQAGHFRLHYTSKIEPIVINRIHGWVLHVETVEGEPVLNADITVDGGMPMHDHGLPTRPRMTQYLGDGDYLIEGMRFHMNGYWEITIAISAGGDHDNVLIALEL